MRPRTSREQQRARFTTSACAHGSSSHRVDGGPHTMRVMDILAVIFGVLSFALLYALLEGIDRI